MIVFFFLTKGCDEYLVAQTAMSPPAMQETQLIPRSRRSVGEGNGNPLQYSCLENPMDRGAWWATIHGVTLNRTCLSNTHTHPHPHTQKY